MERYNVRTVTISLVSEDVPTEQIHDTNDTIRYLVPIFRSLDADQEHGVLLAINVQMKVIGYKVFSSGEQAGCLMDPKIVFRTALLMGAYSVIVAHNHPSGDLTPSDMDIRVTRNLIEAGNMISISLRDHIIIAGDRGSSIISK